MAAPKTSQRLTTNIPARMERLPWGAWHWRVVTALGVTWIIDGLEVTLVGDDGGSLEAKGNPRLQRPADRRPGDQLPHRRGDRCLDLRLFDRQARAEKALLGHAGVYLIGAIASAFAWDFWSFAFFRLITGAGIGGEYSAINSAIDELIPAKVRGRVDLAVNGSYWVGAAVGSLSTLVLLDPQFFAVNLGWRIGFGIGALLGLVVIFYRNHVPESPRWLIIHGRLAEAEKVVDAIEAEFAEAGVNLPEAPETITLQPRTDLGFGLIARTMVQTYPSRSILGLMLMISQAFLIMRSSLPTRWS